MKNKTTITLFGILICLTLVTAGTILTADKWSKDSTLDSDTTDKIKDITEIDKLDIEIGKIYCNDEQCWATIKQDGVINTEWRDSVNYCSEWKECGKVDLKNPKLCIEECIEYANYTLEENKNRIQEFINKRLGSYVIAEEKREQPKEIKSDVGTISEKVVIKK